MKRPSLLFFFLALISWQLNAFNTSPSLLDSLVVSVDNVENASCFSSLDGAISLQVQGDEPFSFLWNNGDTTQNLTGIAVGFYSVVVTDSSGFQVSLDSIEVGSPDELELSIVSLVPPTCNGLSGSLEVAASGGTPDYIFAWSTGDTTAAVQDLPAGDYEVTVIDANACTAVLSIPLQPEYPEISLFSDGDITCIHPLALLSGSGSTAASGSFIFEWTASNGGEFLGGTDTLITSTGVAGTYSLEITDTVNGCSASLSVIVAVDTIAPTADAGLDTLAACTNSVLSLNGNGDGGAFLSFEWTAENGGNIVSGADTLNPVVNHSGTYILTVTNLENGCSDVDTVMVSGVNDPPFATVEGGELTCLVTNIQLSVTADTAGLIFSWSGPNGFTSNELEPNINEAGEYELTLTDTATTCSDVFTAAVLDNTAAPNLAVEGDTISCAVLEVQLTAATTSADVEFTWTGPNGFSSNEQNPSVSEAGEYYLVLIDTLTGCFATDTATVAADTIAPIAAAGATIELTCAIPSAELDGSASSQGENYTYQWTIADGNIAAGAETLNPTVDAVGTYTLIVTDTLNGCSATDEVVVTGNFPLPTVEAIGGSFDCFAGGVFLIGIFDTTNVTFEWTGPNGFVSNEAVPFVSVAGEYTLSVTDTLTQCTGVDTALVIKLGIDPDLTLTANGIITCAITDVQITTTANINTIVYSWAGPNGYSSLEQNPIVSTGGWYTVLAIDTAFGCIALDSILVGMDTVAPSVDAGQGLNFHCNFTSGSLSGTASQSVEFTYLWTTQDGNIVSGDTSLAPLVDAVGTYTLTVTNTVNGCSTSDDVVVTENDPVGVSATASDVLCFGTATGTALATATGGDGNFSFAWSSGSNDASATGLSIGTYTVTATDGNGCSAEATVTISQPDLLTAEAIGTPQTLFGVDDGTATAIPTGGTAPYAYVWSNGETTPAIVGLAPGEYVVTASDANGCTAIASAYVNEFNCVLTSTVSVSNASCFGLDDGTATVLLENEAQPVSFIWSNGDTLATAAGLTAGIYSVSITDSTNCSNAHTILITEPSQISIAEIFHEDVLCPDDTTGSVVVGVTGGAQPYQFAWANGSTSALAHSLAVGQYELTLTDGNGCTAFYTANIISTDNEAPALVLQDLTLILDANGTASITADQLDAGSSDNCGIVSWTVEPDSFDCSQTGDETVTVTATDATGNESSSTVTVTVTDDQAPVLVCPDDISASGCAAEVEFDLPSLIDNCAFDTAQLVLTEGLPSGATFPLGVTVQTFTYTDPAGVTAECTFEIAVVEGFETNVTTTNVSCNGACDGSIDIILVGGLPPYTFEWNTGDTSASLNGLCAGGFTGTITDEGGCTTIINVEITEPDVLEIALVDLVPTFCPSDSTGAAVVAATGGTAPYTFEWSNGSLTDSIGNVPAGTYTVSATDANGCEQVLDVNVTATDNEAPALVLQDIQVELNANGAASIIADDLDNGSTDNCGIVEWTISQNSFGCNDLGENTVTVTATDSNGNESSDSVTVTVVDNISPSLNCPANITAGFCNPVVMFNLPQVSDNCTVVGTNLVQTAGLPSGSTFTVGVTTQTFSYTDASGNNGTCSFTITLSEAANISANATEISCANTCDGSIELVISGGAAPFTVLWSDGQIGTTASGLCDGAISASVTDAAGCLQTFTTTLAEPPALNISIDEVTHDMGNTGIGAIEISVSGGTPPYSFAWTKNGQPFANTEDLANLNFGQYTVAISDANGCEISSQTITVDNINSATEAAWGNGLILQPNPAKDWALLNLESPLAGNLDIRLVDITGKLVLAASLEKGAQQKTVDLTSLAPGVYLVQLHTAGSTVNRRLVVAR